MLLEKVSKIFESYGFEVSDTSFGTQLKDERMAALRGVTVAHPAFHLISHHPDLFVLHRKLPPGRAAFYVVLAKVEGLDERSSGMFQKYFPPEVLVVFESGAKIKCRWVRENVSKPLTDFLDSYT